MLILRMLKFSCPTSVPRGTVARKSSLGGLYVCAGGELDVEILVKTPMVYSVSFVGISPPKTSCGDGIGPHHTARISTAFQNQLRLIAAP